MKLSEAIMLGSATCKMVAGDINSCALGAALNAVGAERHTLSISIKRVGSLEWSITAGNDRYHALLERWPWLFAAAPGQASWSPSYGMIVADLFDAHVVWGDMTLEQLADAVSAVEPQCECNRFDCGCLVSDREATSVEAVGAVGATHGAEPANGGHANWKIMKEEGAICA